MRAYFIMIGERIRREMSQKIQIFGFGSPNSISMNRLEYWQA